MKAAHLQRRVGHEDIALFEETGLGRLPDFSLIKLENSPSQTHPTKINLVSTLRRVKITGSDGDYLLGQLIE